VEGTRWAAILTLLKKKTRTFWDVAPRSLADVSEVRTASIIRAMNDRTTILWFPWLLNLTLDSPRLTGVRIATTSEVGISTILKWLKVCG
jgi:hypothetical protein